jgi:ABC-type lipoprotein release transport system permease subunit
VLAVLVAVAGLAIFGQALARQTFLESIEYPTLRSIGMSPQQLLVVGMIRAGVIGVIGGLVAAVVGFLLSPLTPTGTARIAEPHPGFALDWVVVALGALGTILFVVLLSAVPAWRASRVAGTAEGTAEPRRSRRPSAVAGFLARSAFPPSATAGVRMAFEPGRGRTAVPVRTTIFGATLGLLALAAALGFGASLDRLVTTPGLSGWNWDAIMFSGGDDPKASAAANTLLDRTLDRSRQISAYSLGTIVDARVGTQGVLAVAMEPQRGSVTPSLVEGRLPRGPDEVALGSETMSEVGLGIGDTAPISGGGGDFRMRVVGRVVIPNFFFSFNRPGQGAVLSLAGADRVSPEENQGGRAVYVRFAPGIDQDAFLRSLKHRIPQLFVVPHQTSDQISSLNQVGNVPLILAGIIAFMAAATLGHTLITSIRRRRLDLAILKTLGFERRQISATVAWQATALAVVALGIGIPSGVVAGRWGWNVFADHLGVVPQAVVPVLAVLLALPVTIVVANLLAVIPGRIASRLKAAPVLRSE